MAGQAIPLYGRMDDLLLDFLFQCRMARLAKIGALCREQIVQLRFVGAVALRALPDGNRPMAAPGVFQPSFELGMTFQAQFDLRADDHPRYIRPVGIVAGQAVPVLERFMNRSPRGLCHKLLVAIGTKDFPRCLEEALFL
jgi:hypothetical protein